MYKPAMKVKPRFHFHISADIAHNSFEKALLAKSQARADFFYHIHQSFHEELKTALDASEIPMSKTPLDDFARIYKGKIVEVVPIQDGFHSSFEMLKSMASRGYTYQSIDVNRCERGFLRLPSLLPFKELEGFSIGNFAFAVESNDYDVEITSDREISLHGYSSHISKRKKSCFVAIVGVHFSKSFQCSILGRHYKEYDSDFTDLDEINLSSFPPLFISRRSGQLMICKCFEQYCDDEIDLFRLKNESPIIKRQLENLIIQEGICHLCTGKTPKIKYWGQSVFQMKYQPYFELFRRKMHGDNYPNWTTFLPQREKENEIENAVRKVFGYPNVGSLGISETIVFNLVKDMFHPLEVIHHYRGKELEGLELDVWIPSKKLGIEYQGEQHYEEFKHWGGAEGLLRRKQNDERKKALCQKLNYDLLELYGWDVYTTQELLRPLKNYLN